MGLGRRFIDGAISLLETLRDGFRPYEEPRHRRAYRLEFGTLRSISLERESPIEDDGDAAKLRDLLRDTAPRGAILLDPDEDDFLAILSPERGVLLLSVIDERPGTRRAVLGRARRAEVEAILTERGLALPTSCAEVRPRAESRLPGKRCLDRRDLSSGDPWEGVARVWPLAEGVATAEEITRAVIALWGVPESPAGLPEWWEPGEAVDQRFAERAVALAIRRIERETGTAIRSERMDGFVAAILLPAYAMAPRPTDETRSAWTTLLSASTAGLAKEAAAFAAAGERRLVVHPDHAGKKLAAKIDRASFADLAERGLPR